MRQQNNRNQIERDGLQQRTVAVHQQQRLDGTMDTLIRVKDKLEQSTKTESKHEEMDTTDQAAAQILPKPSPKRAPPPSPPPPPPPAAGATVQIVSEIQKRQKPRTTVTQSQLVVPTQPTLRLTTSPSTKRKAEDTSLRRQPASKRLPDSPIVQSTTGPSQPVIKQQPTQPVLDTAGPSQPVVKQHPTQPVIPATAPNQPRFGASRAVVARRESNRGAPYRKPYKSPVKDQAIEVDTPVWQPWTVDTQQWQPSINTQDWQPWLNVTDQGADVSAHTNAPNQPGTKHDSLVSGAARTSPYIKKNSTQHSRVLDATIDLVTPNSTPKVRLTRPSPLGTSQSQQSSPLASSRLASPSQSSPQKRNKRVILITPQPPLFQKNPQMGPPEQVILSTILPDGPIQFTGNQGVNISHKKERIK
jgi:hypothetical protein